MGGGFDGSFGFSGLGSAVGAIGSMVGNFYNAKAQKYQLQSQALTAETNSYLMGINARLSELAAQSELSASNKKVGAITLNAGQIKSSQRAAMAANGIDLGVGSAAELLASTDVMKEIDKNTQESNGIRNAWGYRTQTMNYQNQAAAEQIQAGSLASQANATSPLASAFVSLLGSAGNVASNWLNLKAQRKGY
jgi:hypothetical protein